MSEDCSTREGKAFLSASPKSWMSQLYVGVYTGEEQRWWWFLVVTPRHLMVHIDGAIKLANPLVSGQADPYTE